MEGDVPFLSRMLSARQSYHSKLLSPQGRATGRDARLRSRMDDILCIHEGCPS